ncbi:MAG: 50S ribosomal protein L10 [Bacteroidales bacterium]|nr:50S ribosomal protein L10 [Lentimicrobiaceae bacterium]MDD5693950.1 50S ribosomal protein L10 [Bacteroidales bacterium]
MTTAEKNQLIDVLAEQLRVNNTIYLTDISDLNSVKTSDLRRLCFKKNVKLMVVKNTLLRKAMEKVDKDFSELYPILKGSTSLMIAEAGNVPARLIREFRSDSDRPILKGAFIEEMVFIGDNQLEFLEVLKTKNELIGDVIFLLQSPLRNVIGALQSPSHKLAGILETLSERES